VCSGGACGTADLMCPTHGNDAIERALSTDWFFDGRSRSMRPMQCYRRLRYIKKGTTPAREITRQNTDYHHQNYMYLCMLAFPQAAALMLL
jgi:hypothetical protein